MSPPLKSQKLLLAAGAACILAIAVVYVLRIQTCSKNKKLKKKKNNNKEPQHEELEPKEISGCSTTECSTTECSTTECSTTECSTTECSTTECSTTECSSTECLSLVDQHESDPMQISAIAAPPPEAMLSDDLRLDSGIGSPKGTPSLENRSTSEQIVGQTSDLIEESFSAVYSQSNGIDSSSLFVEASTISMVESEPELHDDTLDTESTALILEKQIDEVVENICEKTADNMTENSINSSVVNSTNSTNAVANSETAPAVAKANEHSKKDDFSPETTPGREVQKKNHSKKDNSPIKEKASRRKSSARQHKENTNKDQQNDSSPTTVQPKARNNNDDRNNNNNNSGNNNNNSNTRRQSTGSDFVTDSKSEGSADSSKAGSDTCSTSIAPMLYHFKHEFEIPCELCGKLIGRQGSTVKDIRNRTGTIVTVRPHPVHADLKQVYVIGKTSENVSQAMAEIRKRFPLRSYPNLTLNMEDRTGLAALTGAPDYLTLADNQDTVVTVTAIESGNQLYLQAPLNSSFNLFLQQEVKMACVHNSENSEPPALPVNLLRRNAICVMQDIDLCWYRMAVDSVIGPEEVRVKYVDYGGYSVVHPSQLKQIRSDFIYVPFQAIEVLLADIEPVNADGKWTSEDIAVLKSYVDRNNSNVVARVVGYNGRLPCVQLTCINLTTSEQLILSQQLVADGHAKWVTESKRTSSSDANLIGTASSGATFSPADFPQLGATQQTC